jgi:mannose-6-phosphate isomerase
LTGSIKQLMANLYRLCNQIKHYEWGSAHLIPQLLGIAGDGSPWAELWMGSHAGSSSLVSLPSGDVSLGELIAADPRRYLGEKTAQRYGELPFLFKLLAAEKPLSIQAHPNLAQAREGYERENRAQIAYNAPNRNYRDPNHKPEIICALTPFTGMCGFRSREEITQLLSVFHAGLCPAPLRDGFIPLLKALETPEQASALRNFLDALFGLSLPVREALTQFILSAQGKGAGGESYEWELMREFARQYPNDPAIIAPLYLNVFHLEPGKAIFLKAGAPHAYIHGFGVELMANSDNVLRGGLTAKHVDVPELMNVLDFTPTQPRIIKPEPDSGCFTYPVPCEEFALTVIRGEAGNGARTADFARNAPAIGIVTEGEVSISGTVLKQGESAFIPANSDNGKAADPLVLQGHFTLYAASVPGEHAPL